MPIWLLGFLKPLKEFLTSKTFLITLAVAVSLWIGLHIMNDYIHTQVKQQVTLEKQNEQINLLEQQVKTLENNQKIIKEVTAASKPIYEAQKTKSKKIEDNIDEQVKKGGDSYVGPILASTIDGL